MAVLTPSPKMQFESAAGVPLSGGKVYTYAAGTTTPQATFTDYTGTTPNANPIILNSRGEAAIWLGSASYKFKLTDANDVEIWTVDYISAPTSGVSPVLSGNVTIDSDTPSPALKITQTGTGAVLRVQDSADPDATPFVIDNAGNVGVGTATPSAQLETTGAAKFASATITTPLGVASGGTGLATLTANNVLLGNGASAPTFVAPGTAGNVLTSNGTTFTSAPVPVELPSQTGNANRFLTTNGTTPSWAYVVFARGSISSAGVLTGGFNCTVSKTGTGQYTVTLTIAAATADYQALSTANTTTTRFATVSNKATGSFIVNTFSVGSSPVATDAASEFVVFGG